MQKTCLVQCGDQRLLCVLVFGPQFIYMWDMSRSYRPGPKIHLVCFPQTLNTMKFHQFPSNSLYFPMFPLLSLTPFFSTPYNVHLFLLLQSLLSRGVIITSPLDTFPYLYEFPRILTTLEAFLGTFPNVNQCLAANSPKSFDSVQFRPQFGYPLMTFPLAGLSVLGPTWLEHNSISPRTLGHFISELILSPQCLTLSIRANPTVMGLGHMGPSLRQALVTWAIPSSRAQAPTYSFWKLQYVRKIRPAYACKKLRVQADSYVRIVRVFFGLIFQKLIYLLIKSCIFHFNTSQVKLTSNWTLNQPWVLKFSIITEQGPES